MDVQTNPCFAELSLTQRCRAVLNLAPPCGKLGRYDPCYAPPNFAQPGAAPLDSAWPSLRLVNRPKPTRASLEE